MIVNLTASQVRYRANKAGVLHYLTIRTSKHLNAKGQCSVLGFPECQHISYFWRFTIEPNEAK